MLDDSAARAAAAHHGCRGIKQSGFYFVISCAQVLNACRSRAGRGWRKRHRFAPLRFFPVLFVLLFRQRTGRRGAVGPHAERCRPRVATRPVDLISLVLSGLLSALQTRLQVENCLCFWIRGISGPDGQLVPFDLSSADISAFGRRMLRLPARQVSLICLGIQPDSLKSDSEKINTDRKAPFRTCVLDTVTN